MSTPELETKINIRLRLSAETRLKSGTAPPAHTWSTSVEALTLLHKLATSPANAGDALRLLHELQVHQVELDLQHEQMEQNLSELTEDLDRYAQLYEFAPIAYFTIDRDGRIIEGNVAGARLFGVEQNELSARPVDSFLAPNCRPLLHGLLKRLGSGSSRETCEVQLDGGGSALRQLQVVASAAPGGRSFLMAIMEVTPPKGA